jgi:hypothetical protein
VRLATLDDVEPIGRIDKKLANIIQTSIFDGKSAKVSTLKYDLRGL